MFFQQLTKKWLIGISLGAGIFAGIIITWTLTAINGGEEETSEWLQLREQEEVTQSEEAETDIPAIVMVDIKGEVRLPGIYTAESGERVHDCIEKAGGLTEEANERALNLAEKVYDEMVIYVPSVNEEEVAVSVQSALNTSDDRIRMNSATVQELTSLPGIGEAKAEAIVRFREENGPFQTVEELVNVPGIGEKMLEQMKDLIIIP
ncbi:competence protein ComEA [Evansella caseinilytica]|uniref:Competence protein ComEA n=1 Tax=Evansella caseinilytica TaxID=1503961 RepID=A0A1H3KF98_9BACI|nr:helix-hairpin-helix domain-containing protein [Evansella caseinilytica]SDY50813.1 competence protein ComEA [Evansella caseinilytica]